MTLLLVETTFHDFSPGVAQTHPTIAEGRDSHRAPGGQDTVTTEGCLGFWDLEEGCHLVLSCCSSGVTRRRGKESTITRTLQSIMTFERARHLYPAIRPTSSGEQPSVDGQRLADVRVRRRRSLFGVCCFPALPKSPDTRLVPRSTFSRPDRTDKAERGSRCANVRRGRRRSAIVALHNATTSMEQQGHRHCSESKGHGWCDIDVTEIKERRTCNAGATSGTWQILCYQPQWHVRSTAGPTMVTWKSFELAC